MKYKIGDKVVFLKISHEEDAWPLNDYEEYIVVNKSYSGDEEYHYEPKTHYYGVKHKDGTESTWYNEMDFIGLKEYRKLKLEKINGQTIY